MFGTLLADLVTDIGVMLESIGGHVLRPSTSHIGQTTYGAKSREIDGGAGGVDGFNLSGFGAAVETSGKAFVYQETANRSKQQDKSYKRATVKSAQ